MQLRYSFWNAAAGNTIIENVSCCEGKISLYSRLAGSTKGGAEKKQKLKMRESPAFAR
jgi:hypothetical protein